MNRLNTLGSVASVQEAQTAYTASLKTSRDALRLRLDDAQRQIYESERQVVEGNIQQERLQNEIADMRLEVELMQAQLLHRSDTVTFLGSVKREFKDASCQVELDKRVQMESGQTDTGQSTTTIERPTTTIVSSSIDTQNVRDTDDSIASQGFPQEIISRTVKYATANDARSSVLRASRATASDDRSTVVASVSNDKDVNRIEENIQQKLTATENSGAQSTHFGPHIGTTTSQERSMSSLSPESFRVRQTSSASNHSPSMLQLKRKAETETNHFHADKRARMLSISKNVQADDSSVMTTNPTSTTSSSECSGNPLHIRATSAGRIPNVDKQPCMPSTSKNDKLENSAVKRTSLTSNTSSSGSWYTLPMHIKTLLASCPAHDPKLHGKTKIEPLVYVHRADLFTAYKIVSSGIVARIPGVRNPCPPGLSVHRARSIIFLKLDENPGLMRRPGDPGILFTASPKNELSLDKCSVFVKKESNDEPWNYMGEYKILPKGEIGGTGQGNRWYEQLPAKIQKIVEREILRNAKHRDYRERIAKRLGVKTSRLTIDNIGKAMIRGDEVINIFLLECIGYDDYFAIDILKHSKSNNQTGQNSNGEETPQASSGTDNSSSAATVEPSTSSSTVNEERVRSESQGKLASVESSSS
ncbi:hypothetical protein EV361DRAFT_604671 [Lentinula raphanica]|nr:hypothetical protein EV361DRAFT_604671 [Lentinula raphanica]